ncbi:MAG: metallophosphoesterase [Kiritimatiellae bacterium]|nr:metallophosphoesterase [Kiritimatiellia bacterium]MDW8457477.1 metallophosphoesterase [Verrucomicrobiota bacterium]
MKQRMSRREFWGALGAGAVGLGFSRRASWAVEQGPRETVRIAFFTDVHARVEWETPVAMELAADLINRQAADLIIGGGDYITDGLTSSRAAVDHRWKAFRAHLLDKLRQPPILAIGNHDCVGLRPQDGGPPESDPRAAFREELAVRETNFVVEAGDCRIIIIDSVDLTGDDLHYRGYVAPERIAWIREVVERTPEDRPIVLVTHMPLLTTFFQATEGGEASARRNRIVVNAHEVIHAFENRPLPLVLQGHLHVDEIVRWRGTTFITGGAVCGRWWRGPWMGTEPGFGVVTLRRTRVDWEYIPLGWKPRRV